MSLFKQISSFKVNTLPAFAVNTSCPTSISASLASYCASSAYLMLQEHSYGLLGLSLILSGFIIFVLQSKRMRTHTERIDRPPIS